MDKKDNSELNNNKEIENGIIIRDLFPQDLGQFRDLWTEAFTSDPYAFRTTPEKWQQKTEKQISKDFYSSIHKQNFILGAFYGSRLVGMVGIYTYKSQLSLWGTFVRPDFRGKKISEKLIRAAIEKLLLKKSVSKEIYLEVFSAAKSARALYKKIGFKEIEIKPTGEIVARLSL
ncbi:MAG: GNAT family N-acetyltransferase [Bdellovibrio sp.]